MLMAADGGGEGAFFCRESTISPGTKSYSMDGIHPWMGSDQSNRNPQAFSGRSQSKGILTLICPCSESFSGFPFPGNRRRVVAREAAAVAQAVVAEAAAAEGMATRVAVTETTGSSNVKLRCNAY